MIDTSLAIAATLGRDPMHMSMHMHMHMRMQMHMHMHMHSTQSEAPPYRRVQAYTYTPPIYVSTSLRLNLSTYPRIHAYMYTRMNEYTYMRIQAYMYARIRAKTGLCQQHALLHAHLRRVQDSWLLCESIRSRSTLRRLTSAPVRMHSFIHEETSACLLMPVRASMRIDAKTHVHP
jgi:hypothetical protein